MENKNAKKEEIIRERAAAFIETVTNKTSLITVTSVRLYEKDRKADILVTVLPESGEEAALNFLKRQRKEMRDYIKKGFPFHTIPFIDTMIDKGEKARQTIDALLAGEDKE
jgi:ribosome-binding factor A